MCMLCICVCVHIILCEQEIDDNQRQRLLKNTNALHSASDALARTQAVAQETGNDTICNDQHINCVLLNVEDIGIDVIGELHDQRAALIRTKDRVSKQ